MNWIKTILEERFQALDDSRRALKQFGVFGGLILLVLTGVLFLKGVRLPVQIAVGLIGVFFLVSGLVQPSMLRPVYRGWMGVAFVIGAVVSRILLVFIFILVVVPIGLAARICGKRFMELRFEPEKETYWEARERDETPNYENLY